MKKYLLISLLLSAVSAFGQSIVGHWRGDLKITQRASLALVLNVSDDQTITLDSPDQVAYDIPGETKFFSSTSREPSFSAPVSPPRT